MTDRNPIERIGLSFFGRVSASISHEIKNALAIINENAGLLEDLALLAEKGAPLSAERLQRLSKTIRRQVNRTDRIVRKMNRFSHSADQPIQGVNLYHLLVFMTELCERMAALRHVTIMVEPPEKSVVVTTELFLLEHLIWGCIDMTLQQASEGDTVVFTIQPTDTGAEIRLAGLGPASAATEDIFPADIRHLLQNALQTTLEFNSESGEIRIQLPKTIG